MDPQAGPRDEETVRQEEGDSCAICLCGEGEMMVLERCSHSFHRACIWKIICHKNNLDIPCPLCRLTSSIDSEMFEEERRKAITATGTDPLRKRFDTDAFLDAMIREFERTGGVGVWIRPGDRLPRRGDLPALRGVFSLLELLRDASGNENNRNE